MPDKRTKPRFGPLVVKAQVEVDGELRDGYLTNVSIGGAFLAIDDPPAIGAELSLRALLPWNLGELRSRARVVWANPPGAGATRITGVGLAFTRLERGTEERLDAYLQRFAELAAQLDESTPLHDGH